LCSSVVDTDIEDIELEPDKVAQGGLGVLYKGEWRGFNARTYIQSARARERERERERKKETERERERERA
jgi:hypothetical protein